MTLSAAAFEVPMRAVSMYMKKIVIEDQNKRKYKNCCFGMEFIVEFERMTEEALESFTVSVRDAYRYFVGNHSYWRQKVGHA